MPAARDAAPTDRVTVARASLEASPRVERVSVDVCTPTIAEAGEIPIEALRSGARVLCESVDSVLFPDVIPS